MDDIPDEIYVDMALKDIRNVLLSSLTTDIMIYLQCYLSAMPSIGEMNPL